MPDIITTKQWRIFAQQFWSSQKVTYLVFESKRVCNKVVYTTPIFILIVYMLGNICPLLPNWQISSDQQVNWLINYC